MRYQRSGIIHIYRKSVVNDVDKIDFDQFEQQKCGFSGKFRAYAEIIIGMELHRGHHFNNEPRYPRIEQIIEEVQKENL